MTLKNFDESNDRLERRCPRLGGPVSFYYCRTSGEEKDLPCFKIIDCWWEYFDVEPFLKNNMDQDRFDRLVQAKPKPKIQSIVELIEQARKRNA